MLVRLSFLKEKTFARKTSSHTLRSFLPYRYLPLAHILTSDVTPEKVEFRFDEDLMFRIPLRPTVCESWVCLFFPEVQIPFYLGVSHLICCCVAMNSFDWKGYIGA